MRFLYPRDAAALSFPRRRRAAMVAYIPWHIIPVYRTCLTHTHIARAKGQRYRQGADVAVATDRRFLRGKPAACAA